MGLLADERRCRVFGAGAVGGGHVDEIVGLSGLSENEVLRALERLVGAGLIERVPASPTSAGGGLRIVPGLFEEAARDANRMRSVPTAEELGATPEQAAAMRNFLDDSGRLRQLPASRGKRRPILDFAVQRFDPGKVYPERDVNFELGKLYHDTAALRRYLVDEEFLERRDGFYWRSGGTFES